MSRPHAPLLATALALAVPTVAHAAPPTLSTRTLVDGTRLVVAEHPDAREESLRWIVHAGARQDPPENAGLAHLLEHVVLRGDAGHRQRDLFGMARRLGLDLNATTNADATVYQLEGPRGALWRLAPTFIGVITDPTLDEHDLTIELGVVSAEQSLRGDGEGARLLFSLLSPALREQGSVIGSRASRGTARIEALRDYYARYYRPRNTTVVYVGPMPPDAVARSIEAATRLAPHPAPVDHRPPTPRTPGVIDATVPSPLFVSMIGYDLTEAPAGVCDDLARLLALRALDAFHADEDASIECVQLADVRALLVLGVGHGYDAHSLAERAARLFDGLRTRPMSASERALLAQRAAHRRDALLASAPALGAALAEVLARAPPGAAPPDVLALVLAPPALSADAMSRAARKLLVDDNRLSLTGRPF
jgi:hypothetical protein